MIAEHDIIRVTDAHAIDLDLMQIIDAIQRYIILTREQAIAVALWIIHTHCFEAADCTPYLAIGSAAKRSGKTLLLEFLACLVRKPWLTGKASAAVLIRKTDKEHPTLLLDESDATFNQESDYAEALRGLLNSGYRRSGTASLCVGQGAHISYKDFSTFCPKAIAGIGKLPDTVQDRSIPITLKRRAKSEPVRRFRERLVREQTEPLRHQLEAWARANLAALRGRQPALPDELSDRAQDVWEPLLAIADQLGGEWPAQARLAAKELSGAVEIADEDIKIQLLADCRPYVTNYVKDRDTNKSIVPTNDLLAHLHGLEDRPWKEWGRQAKPITSTKIADLLKPYRIYPDSDGKRRGYWADALQDAFNRYLPPDPPSNPSTCQNPNNDGGKTPISKRQTQCLIDTLKSEVSPMNTRVFDALTLQSPDTREAEQTQDDDDRDCCEGGDFKLKCKVCRQSPTYWRVQ